jgi:hypothetical protein
MNFEDKMARGNIFAVRNSWTLTFSVCINQKSRSEVKQKQILA